MSFMTQHRDATIHLNHTFEDAFAAVLRAAQAAGEVQEKSLQAGHIVVRTPMSLIPYRNPATVRISLKKVNDSQTDVEFASESFDGVIGSGAAGAAIDKILNNLG